MVVAAAVGAVGAVGGAVVSSSASKKAAKASQNAANSNNALQSQIYSSNKETLSPYINRGNSAGDEINGLLGLPSGGTGSDGVDWEAYVNGNPDALANWNAIKNTSSGAQFNGDISAFGQYHYAQDGSRRDLTPYESGGTSASGAQNQAFQTYLNSTGYQFQLDQGLKSVQAALGAKGLTDSGAAQKSLNNYAQQQALTGFRTYLGALQGQQSTGLSGASALAGVGQNYANAVSSNNNTAANATGNAALTNANIINGTINSALGAAGAYRGLSSSYGGGGLGGSNSYGISGVGDIY